MLLKLTGSQKEKAEYSAINEVYWVFATREQSSPIFSRDHIIKYIFIPKSINKWVSMLHPKSFGIYHFCGKKYQIVALSYEKTNLLYFPCSLGKDNTKIYTIKELAQAFCKFFFCHFK